MQIGDPREIGRAYHKLNFGQLPHEAPGRGAGATGTAIADAWFENAAGERVTSASQEDAAEHVLRGPLRRGASRTRSSRRRCAPSSATRSSSRASTSTAARAAPSRPARPRSRRFALPNWLTPSRYTLTPSLAREGTGENALALVEDMTSILVHGTTSGGILELPVDVRIERA